MAQISLPLLLFCTYSLSYLFAYTLFQCTLSHFSFFSLVLFLDQLSFSPFMILFQIAFKVSNPRFISKIQVRISRTYSLSMYSLTLLFLSPSLSLVLFLDQLSFSPFSLSTTLFPSLFDSVSNCIQSIESPVYLKNSSTNLSHLLSFNVLSHTSLSLSFSLSNDIS